MSRARSGLLQDVNPDGVHLDWNTLEIQHREFQGVQFFSGLCLVGDWWEDFESPSYRYRHSLIIICVSDLRRDERAWKWFLLADAEYVTAIDLQALFVVDGEVKDLLSRRQQLLACFVLGFPAHQSVLIILVPFNSCIW
jgi:hypothetical protein